MNKKWAAAVCVFVLALYVSGHKFISSNPYLNIEGIQVFGWARDPDYEDLYDEKRPPVFSRYKVRANLVSYELPEENFKEGSTYSIVSMDANGRSIEEKRFDFVYGSQKLRECGLKKGSQNLDAKCSSPVEFRFKINMSYSPDIKKIRLYKGDKTLDETGIYIPM